MPDGTPTYTDIYALSPRLTLVPFRITGAADVNADGYTVSNDPLSMVTSAVKAAEGKITVTLSKKWAACLGCWVQNKLQTWFLVRNADSVVTGPTVSLWCYREEVGATANAGDALVPDLIDPDADVIDVLLLLQDHNPKGI